MLVIRSLALAALLGLSAANNGKSHNPSPQTVYLPQSGKACKTGNNRQCPDKVIVASGESTRFTVYGETVAALYSDKIVLNEDLVFEGSAVSLKNGVTVTAEATVDIRTKDTVAITSDKDSHITAKGNTFITAKGDTTVSTDGKLTIFGGQGTFYPNAGPVAGPIANFFDQICLFGDGLAFPAQTLRSIAGLMVIKYATVNGTTYPPQVHVCAVRGLRCFVGLDPFNPDLTQKCTYVDPTDPVACPKPYGFPDANGFACAPLPLWVPFRENPVPTPWIVNSLGEIVALAQQIQQEQQQGQGAVSAASAAEDVFSLGGLFPGLA